MDKANSAYSELASTFAHIAHLGAAEKTLEWESRTMMPAGAAETRAKVLSALSIAIGDKMADPRLGELLDRAEAEEAQGLSEWETANLREMRRRWRQEAIVPVPLKAEMSARASLGQQIWQEARENNDFKSFLPILSEIVTLQREVAAIKADAFGLSPYDALLDEYEPGARMAAIDPLFDDLSAFLPPLMQKIMDRQAAAPISELTGPFPAAQQHAFSETLARQIGFDFHHGRIDPTAHPFASGIPGDVRITTRFHEDDLLSAIMATVHETGHAMYESGLPSDWAFQPVGLARGFGLHESQSLLFEMQAGRSKPFVGFLTPMLRESFGGDGPEWGDDNILRIYRRVRPSLIRVEADEVTYPMHVILRYRLEQKLLSGELAPADLPQAWNEAYRDMLGVVPPNDTLGCLQDVHWSAGFFGYFPTYTLGALSAAQLFAQATKDDPKILPRLGQGDFAPLLAWTRKYIHSVGSLHASSDEVMQRATGKPLSTDAFKAHLTARYLEE
ncbi:MAG TPA: carboxypeptidase M32 [Rhizomicrobium sp.]|nr:carboxypeptidase M32 [Rhizomicrobium sp.]